MLVWVAGLMQLGGTIGAPALAQPAPPPAPTKAESVRVQVKLGAGVTPSQPDGRLFVVFGTAGFREPRFAIGQTGMNVPTMIAIDVTGLTGARTVTLGADAYCYPRDSLRDLPPGRYLVQAVFDSCRDLRLPNGPGNLYSEPVSVTVAAKAPVEINLTLSKRIPDETHPPETDRIKWIKLRSEKLSQFHGRDMFLRAGVVLPASFATAPDRKYPLIVRIGGFGTRYTAARGGLRRTNGPEFDAVSLYLDGAGPNGDPYQVNSANNGPYGDALVEELIPLVEKTYRCLGKPWARYTTGASTGGWVSAALVIFYPEFFGGCYSKCPDSMDFRAFELIDINRHENAFLNEHGFERPAMRDRWGDVIYTVRNECRRENLMGRGNSFTGSGKDWGSWNAVFGPRGADGRPTAIWDPHTGKLNRSVTKHWEAYDLRLVVERNWAKLAPNLNGKLDIWVGDADDYFLNKGVALFKGMTERLKPKFEGRLTIEPGAGHDNGGTTEEQMLKEIREKVKKAGG
jgi:hypothetical protein